MNHPISCYSCRRWMGFAAMPLDTMALCLKCQHAARKAKTPLPPPPPKPQYVQKALFG